ncbi:dTDP-4-dehydrorhamnose 3,5-epimerase family protein [Octadecabacter sp.]|nr:dTDP-4-dehydrorhamnose 3,5-epimerase family protein [Octadecabacter sp.]
MKIEFKSSKLTGCKYGHLNTYVDARGEFTKLLQLSEIEKIYPGFRVAESYITKSQPGVLRGMHLQLPPDDHEKIVICLEGHVLDVVLELRNDGDYGNYDSVSLSSNSQNFISIPKGVAHGFYAYEFSTLLYLVSTEHAPENDTGVNWNSFGYTWPTENPILSERDIHLPKFQDLNHRFEI